MFLKIRIKRFNIGLALTAAALAISCIERFDLDIPRSGGQYVVDAVLLDDSSYQYVKLHQTTNSGKNEPVTGAIVYLENETGQVSIYAEVGEGRYELPQYLPIQTGETYRLSIDINDSERLRSAWETVPETVEITAGYWRQRLRSIYNQNGVLIIRNGFDFLVNTAPMPQNEVFLRYDYETTHINEAPFVPPLCPDECRNCYIKTLPVNYISRTQLIGQKGKPLEEQLVEFIELDVRFSFRFTMLVKQVSHTKNAGAYYELVAQQRNYRGTLFDPPPAIIRGNMSVVDAPDELVYGLFELGKVSEIPITVFNGEFENQILTYFDVCIQKFTAGMAAPECENCNNEPGAGPRPYYF